LSTARLEQTMLQFPQIDPVALQVGPLAIHWYGLMYVLAFLASYLLASYRANKNHGGWNQEQVSDLMFYAMLGVIVGGRLGYFIFYQPPASYLLDPLRIVMVQTGGMSFHGGMLGVAAGIAFFAHKYKRHFLDITDFVVPIVPLGLAFGRIGNFINGELWGRLTSPDFPLAMVFPHVDQLPRHPSQLYQMALEGFLLFAFLWWYSSTIRPRGRVLALFLIGYGLARFIVEFVRQPDAHLSFIALNWVTMGHLLSLPMIIGGIGLYIYSCRMQRKSNNEKLS